MLAGQAHPSHRHFEKDETFEVLYGDLNFTKDNNDEVTLKPGDVLRVEPKIFHSFSTKLGVVFEEIATEAKPKDSEYQNAVDENRKTRLTEIWGCF